jgi:hypothetical protein
VCGFLLDVIYLAENYLLLVDDAVFLLSVL